MDRLLIRPMEPHDAPVVARLGAQLGYDVDEDVIRRRLERYGASDAHLLVVAEWDGSVVGWAHALERPLLQEPRQIEIGGLVVDARARHTGVGEALVGRVDAWAAAGGYHGLWLHSRIERPAAHAFYPALGFHRIKTSHIYYRRIDSAQ